MESDAKPVQTLTLEQVQQNVVNVNKKLSELESVLNVIAQLNIRL